MGVLIEIDASTTQETNMTIKSEIEIKNLHSLGIPDIWQGMTLRRLMLWGKECICKIQLYYSLCFTLGNNGRAYLKEMCLLMERAT